MDRFIRMFADFSPLRHHPEHRAEGDRGRVAVPPAGAVVAPFGGSGDFYGAGIMVGAGGVGGQKGEGRIALALAFQVDPAAPPTAPTRRTRRDSGLLN